MKAVVMCVTAVWWTCPAVCAPAGVCGVSLSLLLLLQHSDSCLPANTWTASVSAFFAQEHTPVVLTGGVCVRQLLCAQADYECVAC